MLRITALTEAGFEKGFGHFHRMSSIGERAKKSGVPFEMIIDGDGSAKENLAGDGIGFYDWQGEETDISTVVGRKDLVVVDSYNVSLDRLKSIADNCARMIVVDDNDRLEYSNMEILNPNYYGEFMDYPQNRGNRYYLGRDYILLREAFRPPDNRTAAETVENVLVTMGGTDAKGETERCIRMIKAIDPGVTLHVVITSAYRNGESIVNALSDNDRLYKDQTPQQMSELMRMVDFAVASAGGTSNELIKMQCPAILKVVADNQVRNSEIMSKQGCFGLLVSDDRKALESMFGLGKRTEMMDAMKTFASQKTGAQFIVDETIKG